MVFRESVSKSLPLDFDWGRRTPGKYSYVTSFKRKHDEAARQAAAAHRESVGSAH